MKLVNRKNVSVGPLNIQYGHRTYRDGADAVERVSTRYYAECGYGGRRYAVALKTDSEALALHRIHEPGERILAGEGARPAKLTVTELARRYLAYQTSMSRARTTLTKYECVLATFVAWANTHFNRPIGRFTETEFWEWHLSVSAAYGNKTAYDRAVIIKQMFKWGVNKAKLLSANPVSGATLSKPSPNQQPVFSPKQITTLLQSADAHLKPILTMMAYAGLRFGEVRDLRWSMVHLADDGPGHLVICAGGSGDTTKTGGVRQIPLHPELRTTLEAMPRIDERVFHAPVSARNPDGTVRLNESSTLRSLKRLCKACGFAEARKFKLHSLRHTFASMLARTKTPIQYAQALMGHRNSGILALYYHIYDDTAVESIHSIQDPKEKTLSEADWLMVPQE